MTLRNLQNAFKSFLFKRKIPFELESRLVDYSREELEERLAVYRNNVFYSLIDSLQDTYESVLGMVGDEFFNALAKKYIEKHPPQEAAMVFFGKNFPHFIASFEQALPLLYLPDLARLDWARHNAYYAAEATPLQPEAFALIAPQHLEKARFEFHPSCQLIESQYAIYSLWQFANNTTDASDPGVDGYIPEAVFILRPDTDILTFLIHPDLLPMMKALLSGEQLHTALKRSLEASDADFDPSAAVAFLIGSRAITGIIPGD